MQFVFSMVSEVNDDMFEQIFAIESLTSFENLGASFTQFHIDGIDSLYKLFVDFNHSLHYPVFHFNQVSLKLFNQDFAMLNNFFSYLYFCILFIGLNVHQKASYLFN